MTSAITLLLLVVSTMARLVVQAEGFAIEGGYTYISSQVFTNATIDVNASLCGQNASAVGNTSAVVNIFSTSFVESTIQLHGTEVGAELGLVAPITFSISHITSSTATGKVMLIISGILEPQSSIAVQNCTMLSSDVSAASLISLLNSSAVALRVVVQNNTIVASNVSSFFFVAFKSTMYSARIPS